MAPGIDERCKLIYFRRRQPGRSRADFLRSRFEMFCWVPLRRGGLYWGRLAATLLVFFPAAAHARIVSSQFQVRVPRNCVHMKPRLYFKMPSTVANGLDIGL